MHRGSPMKAPLIVSIVAATVSATTVHASHPFDTRDAIETSNFSSDVPFSPDGRRFIVVTQRGNVPLGLSEATLWLFNTGQVQEGLRHSVFQAPVMLTRVAADVNGTTTTLDRGQVITQPRWADDGSSVLFLGHLEGENRELVRVTLADHNVAPL